MTTPFENFVNTALGKSLSADVTLPTADDIPVFTGIGRQVTGKTIAELGIATTTDVSDVLVDANEYTDATITKVWKDQGNYDVSITGAWPTSANTVGAIPIKAGFLWVVTNAGTGTTLTGGVVVSNGDTLRALIDDAGNNAAHWGANEANLGYTPENVTNKKTSLNGGLTSPDDTTYPTTKVVDDALDLKADLSLVGKSPPAYTASVVYAVGQLVTHLGHVWSITVAHTGAIPFVNGNLELEGSVFNAGTVSTPYTVPKLGTATNPIDNKEVRITGLGATFSLNVANAPFITRWSTTNAFNVTQLTVTAAGATFYTDSSSTSVGTGSFVVLVPGGSEVVIVRYATEVLVKVISLNSVDRFKLIDAGTNGTANLGWNFSGNATANRTITVPDADVNLGTLPSVATTNSNNLSGTRTRILGGSSNTVSGTDNIAIGCTGITLNGIGQIVLGATWSSRLKCNDITVLGSAQVECTNIKHFLYKGTTASCYLSNAAGQANVATPDTTNCPRATLTGIAGVSLFELRFVSSGFDVPPTFIGSISGCRVFSVHSDGVGGYTVSAVATPYADMATHGLGMTFAITVITAVGGEKLLQIIPTVSGLGASGVSQNYATLDAIYQW